MQTNGCADCNELFIFLSFIFKKTGGEGETDHKFKTERGMIYIEIIFGGEILLF